MGVMGVMRGERDNKSKKEFCCLSPLTAIIELEWNKQQTEKKNVLVEWWE